MHWNHSQFLFNIILNFYLFRSSNAWVNQNSVPRFRHQNKHVVVDNSLLILYATKSGGIPIESQEQFQVEVLHEIVQSEEESNFEPNFKPILVFFTAPWCGPCRLANPVVKEIVTDFNDVLDVVEVCTDDIPEIAEEAGVVSIPTIQLYHRGILLDTIVGCVAKNVLASAVNKILEDLGLEKREDPL
jgi:thioredoxin 1